MSTVSPTGAKPNYGLWIRVGRLWLLLSLVAASLIGFACSLLFSPWFTLFVVPFAVLAYTSLIVGVSAYRLSPSGGDFQGRIHELVVSLLDGQEEGGQRAILDVGCGNASLTVKVARRFPDARVCGIDFWGEDWGYSKQQCELNAGLEGVGERVSFERQSASALDLTDGAFDIVVSCLTFHEVEDTPNKLQAVHEAMRVLRSGGQFVFVDLFGDRRFFASPGALRTALVESGADVQWLSGLNEYMRLPFPLMDAKVLRYAMVVGGRKN